MRFRWKWIFPGSLRPTVTASGCAILNGEATVAAMASRVRLAARRLVQQLLVPLLGHLARAPTLLAQGFDPVL